MTGKLLRSAVAIALSATVSLGASHAQALDKFTVAGWGPAISEITNLLHELLVAFAICLVRRNGNGLVFADGHTVHGLVEPRDDLAAPEGKFQRLPAG